MFRSPRRAAPFDPREQRLRTEHQRLQRLAQESDSIRVEPFDIVLGSEPEAYRITFLCRGIVGIDAAQNPVYGDKHVVEIRCSQAFPADVPQLRWVTPIWHPNIQHQEPKNVCVNKSEWLGGMGLDDLCRQLFEMVQYKNYHAKHTRPYPYDQEVARWVREVAEPRGIVSQSPLKSVDDRPFTRPTAPFASQVTRAHRIRVGVPNNDGSESRSPQSHRIRIVKHGENLG